MKDKINYDSTDANTIAASDKIGAYLLDGTGNPLSSTGGSLNVNVTNSITVGGGVADSAPDSGNPLKVGARSIAGALVSTAIADNDRTDLISDPFRRIWVNNAANVSGANAAFALDNTAGGTALLAALPGRRLAKVQNAGLLPIWVGFGTVTTANGYKVSPGSDIELPVGPDQVLKGITASVTPVDTRVIQVA